MSSRVAVLASGGGTTVEAFIRATEAKQISSRVELVIVSRQDAGVFQRIENLNQEFGLNIKTTLINNKTHPDLGNENHLKGQQTRAEEAAILEILTDGNFDLIALMGYMKRIGANLITAFGWLANYHSIFEAKMVNTHPGLLPDTKGFYGEHIQQYVLDNNLPYGGQSLHVVSSDYDDGPIIAEHKVTVEPDDSAESLFARVQMIEKKYLPGDIDSFIKARLAYINNQ
jgi:phosphoribosylglycinamide formyltransferase-1